jgi:ATP-dependent RNA helicase DHX8/PRP22
MDELEELELLGLVSKVTSEINNYMGISDKTIAEFVISQHGEDISAFKAKLSEFDFPASLTESIDRLVRQLHPAWKTKQAGVKKNEDGNGNEKSQKFRGLAIPDKAVEMEEDDLLDDTFALLESRAGPTKTAPPRSQPPKRSISPATRHESSRKRSRRSRSRSRSPRRKNDEFLFEDEFGRTRAHKPSDSSRPRKSRRDSFERKPQQMDDAPVLYKIYDGRVTGVKDFGVFVNLQGVRGKVDGLVHVSAMAEGKVNHPSDLVSRNQEVKVKVMKMDNNRISLSMAEADQRTGQDLNPSRRLQTGATGANAMGLNGAPGMESVQVTDNSNGNGRRPRKRMTSPERWEIRQLIASGVVKAADYPDLDEEYNAIINGEQIEEEEDVDIEVREEEPPFLAGQTKQSLELSPIRVIKAPDGSMNRAAMQGDVLAKERRDLRQSEAQDKAAKEAAKTDLAQEWNDPMVAKENRRFASDLRQTNQGQQADVPEWKKIATNKSELGKRTNMSIKEQRESLPAFKMRKQFLEAVRQYQLLIVVGDTGSGKTTQLTQYLAEDGFANNGIIGCTQPRRVAAMSVAARVSDEVGCRLGEEVGYTIRFEDKTSESTKIKYMTDGIMQREILLDPELTKYSVIMLDEAHERTIATDVLFGLLKKTLKKRPDMKVIVTSATLDAEKFSTYFNECPILTIPGRTYPVEIMYSREPESDYLDSALTTIMQIHLSEGPGDILLFLTGKEEIDTSCEILHERMKALGPSVPELIILPRKPIMQRLNPLRLLPLTQLPLPPRNLEKSRSSLNQPLGLNSRNIMHILPTSLHQTMINHVLSRFTKKRRSRVHIHRSAFDESFIAFCWVFPRGVSEEAGAESLSDSRRVSPTAHDRQAMSSHNLQKLDPNILSSPHTPRLNEIFKTPSIILPTPLPPIVNIKHSQMITSRIMKPRLLLIGLLLLFLGSMKNSLNRRNHTHDT